MKTIARALFGLALSTVLPCIGFSLSVALTPEIVEMDAIVASPLLSQTAKVAKLENYFDKWKCDYWPAIFYRLEKVDWVASARVARRLFDDFKNSDADKYEVGSYLLKLYLRQKERPPDCLPFATQYRDFLVKKILDGGEAEFCKDRPVGILTAVGEYAEFAGTCRGEIGKLFCAVRDTRLVDILIRCLSAPNCVYGPDNPVNGGKSVGTNAERDLIPLVLVRLRATSAIPLLRSILETHQDIGMRDSARRALELDAYPEYLWE